MTNDDFDADFIVVGSGPAGVSVTFPLIEAGARVLMIDGSGPDYPSNSDTSEPWRLALGHELEALLPDDGLSPKLRTPESRRIIDEFHHKLKIRSDSFMAIGGIARGGLSRVWGSLVSELDARDIQGWPFSINDLKPSYKAVTQRMGVSGSQNDEMSEFYGRSGEILPPLLIGPTAGYLLKYYRPGLFSDFALGIARNAILTVDRDGRKACDHRKKCLWQCGRGAVYDSRFDLVKLATHHEFRIMDHALATRLSPRQGGWEVCIQDGRRFPAPRVILAAGALATSALAVPLLPNPLSELRVLSNPLIAMPLIVPRRLGCSAVSEGHSVAQLGYRLFYRNSDDDYVTGAIYEIDSLPASNFVTRLPLSRPAANEWFAAMAPSMLVASGYFHGRYSENRLRLQRHHGEISVTIRGGFDAELSEKVCEITRRLRKIWRRLGAWMLPGTELAPPGGDGHYAGPFGMGQEAEHGTTMFGQMNAAPGVYIVDGAAIPTLPSKHITLTIMANADRIGRHLATLYQLPPQRAGIA
jgi:choline dehydrogenase-like flavoprotein